MLLGINERLLPLTGGQPLAVQIRSLVVALHLEIHSVYEGNRSVKIS
ncbi:hypothetical protein XCR1_2790011 [Xenorhabdus cabanillasii JM26]|uniref:Transposase n=1 Tax=Xenorhabdus cabanillasii JM26 TaxID=1427517 RepID=W1J8H8_9GAMM|nr:hypothetical protein XCR1_2790011 [Xenorhabdus cabanillasii JM26]